MFLTPEGALAGWGGKGFKLTENLYVSYNLLKTYMGLTSY